MSALKVLAIILISFSCCGYALPTKTESLTSIIDKFREEIPRYKDTLLNNTFLPFLNNCDKTEATAVMCNSYMEMVVILSKTPNQTLFETQADVNNRLQQLPKSFNSSNVFNAFCSKFTENYPNNTQYYSPLSDKMYCWQSCSDINEVSKISKLCALIYIGYSERIPAPFTTPVNTKDLKENGKSVGLQGETSNVDANEIPKPDVNGNTASENVPEILSKQPEAQQSVDSKNIESKIPQVPPVLSSIIQSIIPPNLLPLQKNETNKPAGEPNALLNPLIKEEKDVETPNSAHNSINPKNPINKDEKDVKTPDLALTSNVETSQAAEHKATVPLQESKSVFPSEDDYNNHGDEDTNEAFTDKNPDYGNEDVDNPNTDQESSPVKYSKPQKVEVSPPNQRDVITRPAVVEDPYSDNVDSNFFAYFMFLMLVCVVCYVGYHNKSKVFALLLEGRRSSGGRNGIGRRKHTAAYRKLDTNLEEAISSNSSGRTTQIIY